MPTGPLGRSCPSLDGTAPLFGLNQNCAPQAPNFFYQNFVFLSPNFTKIHENFDRAARNLMQNTRQKLHIHILYMASHEALHYTG